MSEAPSALRHSMTMALIAAAELPPGRQVHVVLESLERDGWHHTRETAPVDLRPEPNSWTEYHDQREGLVATGIATTPERTTAAMAELGLDPSEVRAVVIERHAVRVFRYSDRKRAQTMPIITLEDP